VFLFLCNCGSRQVFGSWDNDPFKMLASLYVSARVWYEPTFALISEPMKRNVAIGLYTNSHAGAVADTIAVVAFLLCYLEGGHTQSSICERTNAETASNGTSVTPRCFPRSRMRASFQ
jgi:hypothetical protein